MDKNKKEALLEVIWLLTLSKPLYEYYDDVKVEAMLNEDGMFPSIFIHGIPVTPDEVEDLLAILPAEREDLKKKWNGRAYKMFDMPSMEPKPLNELGVPVEYELSKASEQNWRDIADGVNEDIGKEVMLKG